MAAFVYALTSSGHFNIVHAFPCYISPCPRGSDPNAVVQDADGNLLAQTAFGGQYERRHDLRDHIEPPIQLLHSFTYGNESGAFTGLTLANDGNLYGTTEGSTATEPFRVDSATYLHNASHLQLLQWEPSSVYRARSRHRRQSVRSRRVLRHEQVTARFTA